MKLKSLPLALALLCVANAYAQGADSTDKKEEPKFSVRPLGKIFIDGALYVSPQKGMFKDGFAIPDVRLGASMTYGKWKAKVDVAFAYNKVGLKDVYMEYDFTPRDLIRGGSFIHHFGLNGAIPATIKPTAEEPVSNCVFEAARQLGVMYQHSDDKIFASASFHMEPKATTLILRPTQFTQEGYGFLTRLAWHPDIRDGKIVQIGISGGFATPQNNGDPDTHDSFRFAADFPTRVTQVNAIDANVDHAMNLWKFSPDVLLNYGRIALESQYYYLQVNRRNGYLPFRGQGAYVILRGLILGKDYSYDRAEGCIATPGAKSLELAACYNYTDITDVKAGIYGGTLNSATATLSYHINKYILARLHYSYTHTWNRRDISPVSLNAISARIQVMF